MRSKRRVLAVLFLCILCLSVVNPPPGGAAQNSYSLRTAGTPYTGPAFIGDVNSALQALASGNSGSAAPTNVYGPMTWVNTATNPNVIEMYDGVQWVPIGQLNTSTHSFMSYGALVGFSGLQVENDTVSPATKIDVLATSLGVTNGTSALTLFGINLTGAAAINTAATGVGGMDSAIPSGGPWDVHIYVIYNGSTVAGFGTLLNPLTGLPEFPAGYSYYRYVGTMIYTNSALVLSVQVGTRVIFDGWWLLWFANTAQNWTTVSALGIIPPTSTRGLFALTLCGNTSGTQIGALRKNGSGNTTGHQMGYIIGSATSVCTDWVDTDSLQQVQLYISAPSNGNWILNVVGFELNL